jgi:CelD/BcsL family acetyltransferase involved in cellulose biosynthesis
MKWQSLPIREFDRFATEWDRVGEHAFSIAPFLRSIFIRPLLRQFARGDEWIVSGNENGETRVAAILQKTRPGIWQTFQPSQLPLGAILARPDIDLPEVLGGVLAAAPGASVLLGLTQLDPLVFPRPQPKPRLEVLDYIETASVAVTGTFDAYWAARGKNLRHNIRKQHSKLAEEGIQPRLELLTRPQDVESVLRDYGALESVGWKAAGGTAIHPENPQGRFYREMLEAYCAAGHGKLYRYWFGDRVAAVDLCVTSDETLVILKTTYDESVQGYSPAFLMRHAAFGGLFEEGRIRRIEFYGKLMDWHKRWTEESRTLYHLNYYRWDWLMGVRSVLSRTKSPQRRAPEVSDADDEFRSAG